MTTATASTDQRDRALQIANETRLRRAELKRELGEMGRAESLDRVASLIADPPQWLRKMLAFELIAACPRMGNAWTKRVFGHADVKRTRQIGELVPREVAALGTALRRARPGSAK